MGVGFRPGEGVIAMMDFLYECAHKMSTGEPGVDRLNTVRLSMQPEYWALIDYLSAKGVLDEMEFAEFLGRHFKAQVAGPDHSAGEPEAE